ncbi:MAG: RHS repeat-associated core domain-containing protein [Bacteroidota bacterium]
MDYLYTVNGNLKAINWADPTNDPGGDGADVFGMTLNYHPEDYSSAQMPNGTLGQSSFPDEAQYTGNIQAQEWKSPVDGYDKKAYSYSYDERQQLKTANFGNTATGSFIDEGKYDVNISEYDENGNIKELRRTGETGNTIHDLTYEYSSEGNQLERVMQGDSVFRSYTYNAIGQMVSQQQGAESMYIDYDVTGKMESVYANDAKTDTIMHIQYDDKGFRLSKTSYDSTYQANFKTWYVRDASGTVMNIYVEALQTAEAPIVYETPVYGSGRLGAYRPSMENEGGEYYYEVKDHLGNVRVVIGGRDSVTYLATMEDERAAEEIEYFSGLKSTTVGSHLNHTPESEVANADRAVRINNVMDAETQPIGGAITLRVFPGDTLKSKVYAKYEDNSDGTTEVLPTLASFLATAYGMPVGGEGVSNIFDVLDQSTTGIIGVKDDFDESQPDIYLNYLLYDDDFNLVDFGIDPISTNAEIPADPTAMTNHAFDELANEIIVEKPGFVYIYISNEDERNITAYFDDFEVKHTYGNIAVAKDQYPFGLAMEGRKLERKYWRYGYQGEYSEKDKETKWNAFQLRQFDPVIGRWMSPDPYGQYPSPYLAMGNRPQSVVDPDGGCADDDYDCWRGAYEAGIDPDQLLNTTITVNDSYSFGEMLQDIYNGKLVFTMNSSLRHGIGNDFEEFEVPSDVKVVNVDQEIIDLFNNMKSISSGRTKVKNDTDRWKNVYDASGQLEKALKHTNGILGTNNDSEQEYEIFIRHIENHKGIFTPDTIVLDSEIKRQKNYIDTIFYDNIKNNSSW